MLDAAISRLQRSTARGEASTQTSLARDEEGTLHQRLRGISETYAARRARNRASDEAPSSIEEYARASEARYASELSAEVRRVKEVEVALAVRNLEIRHRDELEVRSLSILNRNRRSRPV